MVDKILKQIMKFSSNLSLFLSPWKYVKLIHIYSNQSLLSQINCQSILNYENDN